MKLVSIYKNLNGYKIHSNSLTDVGLWLASEPYFNIKIDSNLNDIMNCIVEAMLGCKFDVHYEFTEEIDKLRNAIFFKSLNVKSLYQLYKNAKYCNLTNSGEIIEILPFVNKGARRGLFPLYEKKKIFKSQLTQEIVEELIYMLNHDAE